VLQEVLYRYAGLKRLDLAREGYNLFVALCPVIVPVTLADTRAERPRDAKRRLDPCLRQAHTPPHPQ
jgi:hypothetical protein